MYYTYCRYMYVELYSSSPRPCGCPSCSLSGAAAVDGQRCPHGAATAGQSRRGGRAHARGRTGAALGQDRGLEGPREGRAVGLPPTGLPGLFQPAARGWAGHAKCASGEYAARASVSWQPDGCGVDRCPACANATPSYPSTSPLFALVLELPFFTLRRRGHFAGRVEGHAGGAGAGYLSGNTPS